jgi:hypothetical protein
MDKLGRAMLADIGSAFDATLTNIEKLRGLGLRHFANWRKVSPRALPHVGQLRRHHGALALVEVTPPKIQADDKANRVRARVAGDRRLSAGFNAGPVTIPPIQNLILVNDYRFANAMLLDVLNQGIELLALEQREDFISASG